MQEITPAEDTLDRFGFGQNWSNFLKVLDENRINTAEKSVAALLKMNSLIDKTFLDAGSGSGLFSLVAYRLGGTVTSFDYDPQSVNCTKYLKKNYAQDAEQWKVSQGSLLSHEFMSNLGTFDVVYCWGVAHHTGNMWKALEHLSNCVKPEGKLVLAIYNDQLYISQGWTAVKKIYQKIPTWIRPVYIIAIFLFLFMNRLAVTFIAMLLRLITLRNPFVPILNWYREQGSDPRGMHAWYDLVDWIGGWPYEVARPEVIFRYYRDKGFILEEMTTSTGHGCNEFVFRKSY